MATHDHQSGNVESLRQIVKTLHNESGSIFDNAIRAPFYKELLENAIMKLYQQQPNGETNYRKTDNLDNEGEIGYLYLSEEKLPTIVTLMLHGQLEYRQDWHNPDKPVALINLEDWMYTLTEEGVWEFQEPITPFRRPTESIPVRARGMNETLKRDTTEVMKALGIQYQDILVCVDK